MFVSLIKTPWSDTSQPNNSIIRLFNNQPKNPEIIYSTESQFSVPNKQYSWIITSQQLFTNVIPSNNWSGYIEAEYILKRLDEKIRRKIIENPQLRRTLINSIIKIEDYFLTNNKRFVWSVSVWNDVDDPAWHENIITIKTEYKNNSEKRQMWKEVNSIIEQIDEKKISIIIEIKRL
jgi:hypothetical protein